MRLKCPQCSHVLSAPGGATDGQARCPHCGSTFDLAQAERVGLDPGDKLGDYRVEALVGRGGMATVYRGTQLSLDRAVAIKVLAPGLARRKQFVERFQREARLLAQLSHPNIVGVLSVGTQDDVYYLVMEYVDGESLRARLDREGSLPLQHAVGLVDQVAAGLAYAHGRGVLHRDIKPGNILIGRDGVPKIVDFGIARMVGRDSALQKRLTMTSTQMGSAHYMAPEQMKDAASVDHRADLYALGVLLYEALTGELPIGQFPPASRLARGVPTAVDKVIRTALAASPGDRFDSAERFRAALHRAALVAAPTRVKDRRPRARPAATSRPSLTPILVGAAALLIALILVAAFLATRRPKRPAARPAARRPPTSTPAIEPTPTEAGQRESAAEQLFRLAARQAALGKWRTADRYLRRLDAEYASTSFCGTHRAAIDELRTTLDARLRPQAPATRTTAEPQPPREPEPIEEPGPKPPAPPSEQTEDSTTAVATERAAAEAQRLYAKAVEPLRPLWAKRQYAQALAAARTAAAEGPLADTEAARWLADDAGALAELWKAVEAGAARLTPGQRVRVGGVEGAFEKLEDGTISLRQGPVSFAKKLVALTDVELTGLAGAASTGREHFARALFWLHREEPDVAKAAAALALAEDAGVDVARHRALLKALEKPPATQPTRPVVRPPAKEPEKKKRPRLFSITVAVRIDGNDELHITPKGLHWQHKSFNKPSRVTVNGQPWPLRWQGDTSDTLAAFPFPRTFRGWLCKIEKTKGRGRVSLLRSRPEGFVIHFKDDHQLGADAYAVRILVGIPRGRR